MKLNPYYTNRELKELGFRALGRSVLISRTARIYTPEQITVGSHVLIDDFAILNGEISLGDYTHVSSNCELYAGEARIEMGDFCELSSRCAVYAMSDDYSGKTLFGPQVPAAYRGQTHAPVIMERFTLIGTGSTVLPGVTVGEGCAFGAMTLVNRTTEPWGVYAGVPARRIREREKDLAAYAKKLTGG